MLAASEAASNQAKSATAVNQTLLVHYMPWFVSKPVRGEWGKHWTGNRHQFDPEVLDDQGLPQLASHYHPLIGPYDSSDPHAIECHLLQMKLAGIGGVIVDWYGLAKHDDYPQSHEATSAILVGAKKYGLAFAVCFEDRTAKQLVEHGKLKKEDVAKYLASTFEWLEKNWFSEPNYYRIDNRPLLLNFGPIYVTDAAAWREGFSSLKRAPKFFALNHLWQGVDADGGFTWVYPKVWEDAANPEKIEIKLTQEFRRFSSDPARVIVSACAGFNDRYEHGYPDIPHRDGQTLRETLATCSHGDWPIVQLVTWNDFGEGTMIEPCHELGYSRLEIIQEHARDTNSFLQATAADLRLPEKLYRLRKSGAARVKLLDEAADRIARGETDAARQILKRLSDTSSAEETHRSFVRPPIDGSRSLQLASNTIGEGTRY